MISLRVSVPHYVPGLRTPRRPGPAAPLEQTTGSRPMYQQLDQDVTDWSNRVDEAVASDDESKHYVARLERQVDNDEELLPSGDDLAAELEAFLRDQRRSNDRREDAEHRRPDPATPTRKTPTRSTPTKDTDPNTDADDGRDPTTRLALYGGPEPRAGEASGRPRPTAPSPRPWARPGEAHKGRGDPWPASVSASPSRSDRLLFRCDGGRRLEGHPAT